MSHFFFQRTVIQSFWSSIQQLFGNHIITESDVILGITHQSEDALLNNHLILLSKQYIFIIALFTVYFSDLHYNAFDVDVRQFRAETAKLPEIASHPRPITL